MAVQRATEFEVLRVFHTLWKSRGLEAAAVKRLLKEEFDLELTVLANGEISAQSPDGKIKYSIK
jgi:hypothetical protein